MDDQCLLSMFPNLPVAMIMPSWCLGCAELQPHATFGQFLQSDLPPARSLTFARPNDDFKFPDNQLDSE